MPAINDIIRFSIVTELQGVQMQNQFLYRVDALGVDDGITDNLNAFITEVGTAINTLCSNKLKISCGKYENLSQVEMQQIVFVNIPGGASGDSHPQNQVLRFNSWGFQQPGDERVINNGFNLSGVSEDHSTKGRYNGGGSLVALLALLNGQTDLVPAAAGWSIQAMVYGKNIAGGAEVYRESRQSAVNRTFNKLRQRTTQLCAI
jgi:hypothetical protein